MQASRVEHATHAFAQGQPLEVVPAGAIRARGGFGRDSSAQSSPEDRDNGNRVTAGLPPPLASWE